MVSSKIIRIKAKALLPACQDLYGRPAVTMLVLTSRYREETALRALRYFASFAFNVSLFLERIPFAQSSQRTAKLGVSKEGRPYWFIIFFADNLLAIGGCIEPGSPRYLRGHRLPFGSRVRINVRVATHTFRSVFANEQAGGLNERHYPVYANVHLL